MKKFAVLCFVILCFVFWIINIEPNILVVKKKSLHIPNWDKRLDGYKIGIISDMHIGTKNVNLKKVEQVVSLINEEKVDLIVLLGDFDAHSIVDSKTNPADISNIMKKLNTKQRL